MNKFLLLACAMSIASNAAAEKLQLLSAGHSHTCAIDAESKPVCWGDGTKGQAGNGQVVNVPLPEPVATIHDWIGVSAGGEFACGVRKQGRTIHCWGSNSNYELGQMSQGISGPDDFLQGIAALGFVAALDTGRFHGCAVGGSDQRIFCWGFNSDGQVALPSSPKLLATTVTPSTGGVAIAVAAGEDFSCAALDSGMVECWGRNEYGQLGVPVDPDLHPPGPVPGIADAVDVSAGNTFACARHATGKVSCWGNNGLGQAGGSVTAPQPPQEVPGVQNVSQLSAGAYHVCAVSDGNLVCWGKGSAATGENILNDEVPPATTPHVVMGGGSVREVSAGWGHTCALDIKGRIHCFGDDSLNQLGTSSYGGLATGSLGGSSTPLNLDSLGSVKKVAVGGRHTCVLSASGSDALGMGSAIRCWGANFLGQVGSGSITDYVLAEENMVVQQDAIDLHAGSAHTCALMADATVVCWGDNRNGQVGIDSSADVVAAPAVVPGLADVLLLATSADRSCAVDATGAVRCWGSNVGQTLVPDTSAERLASPVLVHEAGPDAIAQLVLGDTFGCVVYATGNASCWGSNSQGELARGFFSSVSETLALGPLVLSVSGNPVSAIAPSSFGAGSQFACATRTNGAQSLLCWGSDEQGTLANGAPSLSSAFARAMGNGPLLGIGAHGACAKLSAYGGQVVCWGRNDMGQLGTGSTEPPSVTSPAATQWSANTTQMDLGEHHTCAVTANTQTLACTGARMYGESGVGTPTSARTPQLVEYDKLFPTSHVFADDFEPSFPLGL